MPAVWAIDGVEVPAAVARAVAFVGSGGAEGIVEPDGLRVAPLATPGTSIRVLPGAAVIRNRYPGGSLQSYALLEQVQQEVPIVATGSSGARTDMVIARVTDPEFASGTAGASFTVIRGVPSNAGAAYVRGLGYPAIPLARIRIPASTATITQDMITDLRSVARPRTEAVLRTIGCPAESVKASTAWQDWPSDAATRIGDIDVPEWATRVRIVVTWAGVGIRSQVYGEVRTIFGGIAGGQPMNWDTEYSSSDDPFKINIIDASNIDIPPEMRGTAQQMRLQARASITDKPANRYPWLSVRSNIIVQLTFEEGAW